VQSLGDRLTRIPSDFHPHAKIARLLQQRSQMAAGTRPIDFGMAEAIAFATLLEDGVPVRLSGQDSIRGTFSHRHAVLVDIVDERRYCPLAHLAANGARFEVYNSPLSEAAVLGFEYGYSRDYPEALVLWEAQFGDFANNAQVIIDQFIASAEDKWRHLSGLTLLLPHGYEGQGPEHSSARLERFLQVTAEDNVQICQPSTAVQYFHVLRRQALSAWRIPLVIFTPKSMLRHSSSSSSRPEFAEKRFVRVLPDRAPRASVHRKNRPRTSRRTSEARRRADCDPVGRAACALSVSRARGGIRALLEREGLRVGTGGAGEHGRSRLHDASPATHARQAAVAFGAALCFGEPCDRFGKGARHRTADAPCDGVRDVIP
jgi:2-oxoglutarate dehydrogenase complex dehydrogenase (E1) component-like enzyme